LSGSAIKEVQHEEPKADTHETAGSSCQIAGILQVALLYFKMASSLATGMGRDYAAVENGLRLPYSTGPVEGNINRLKLIKRSGYGRASFNLLRIRVLAA
jgi:transposase